MDGVDEHHRIDRVQWPVLPLDHLGDLPSRQPVRRQRQHHLIDPVESALSFADHNGLERAVPVTGHLQGDRAQLGVNRLGTGAVALVAALRAGLPGPVAVLVAQVFVQLGLQRGLQHLPGQRCQRAARPDQTHPLSTGLLDQLRGHRVRGHLPWIRHSGHRVGHDTLPSSPGLPGVSGQTATHRFSDSPEPSVSRESCRM